MSETKGEYIRGGDGSHWDGCEETHWDCKIAKMQDEIDTLKEALERCHQGDGYKNICLARELITALAIEDVPIEQQLQAAIDVVIALRQQVELLEARIIGLTAAARVFRQQRDDANDRAGIMDILQIAVNLEDMRRYLRESELKY